MPIQRRDYAFGGGFVGGHFGGQSDLSKRADRLRPARNLACQAQRIDEGGVEIDASGKAEKAP